jgi:glutathione S-transferase
MKLYITKTSPYARLARIVVIEKKLSDRVEVIEAQTRTAGSPYYAINPSGRVPCLIRDDGSTLEDSQVICTYLDALDGKPGIVPAHKRDDWAYGRLEAYARSMLDGIAVWTREMRRPENERSPTTLQHEADRCSRMTDFWEREIGHPLMQGPVNMAQLLLISAIDTAEHRKLRDVLVDRAKLAVWARKMRQNSSVKATAPGTP